MFFLESTTLISDTYFIECNHSQIQDHIEQIQSMWDINIESILLSHKSNLPKGKLISTYFHYSDIRSKWPEQLHNIAFVSISPDQTIKDKIDKLYGTKKIINIRICDLNEEQSLAIHADLLLIFPKDKYKISTCIVEKANELIKNSNIEDPVLFTPRVWAQLTEEEKNYPGVFKVVYKINNKDLNVLGKNLNWKISNKKRS